MKTRLRYIDYFFGKRRCLGFSRSFGIDADYRLRIGTADMNPPSGGYERNLDTVDVVDDHVSDTTQPLTEGSQLQPPGYILQQKVRRSHI